MKKRIIDLWRDDRGAATIEYILLLLPLLALIFSIFQIVLAFHFALTAQKAVELGARLAAVRDPVRLDMPRVNEPDLSAGAVTGTSCASGGCVTPIEPSGGWTCDGDDLDNGVCDRNAYAAIFDEVARIAYLLDPDDLSITYYYGALGFADGPFTPVVEVSIAQRPFFLQFFFNLGFASGDDDGVEELLLPAVAASAIAEDMSSSN